MKIWRSAKRIWTLLTTEEVVRPDGTTVRRTASRPPRG